MLISIQTILKAAKLKASKRGVDNPQAHIRFYDDGSWAVFATNSQSQKDSYVTRVDGGKTEEDLNDLVQYAEKYLARLK